MRPDRTRLTRLLALVVAGLVTGAGGLAVQAQTPAPDAVVATVDGIKITERDLAIAAEDLASSLQQVPDAQRRDYLVGYMADLKLGARAAAHRRCRRGSRIACPSSAASGIGRAARSVNRAAMSGA